MSGDIPEAELEKLDALVDAQPPLPAENLDRIADTLAEIRVHHQTTCPRTGGRGSNTNPVRREA